MEFRVKYMQLCTEFFDLKIFHEAIINVASITAELPLPSQIYHIVAFYILG
jgi:hypothetical protein